MCSLLHPGPPELAHDVRAGVGLVLPAGLLRTDEHIPSKIVIISVLFFGQMKTLYQLKPAASVA